MPKRLIKNILQIGNAFIYSCHGLISAVKNERAIRQELFFGIFFVPAAFYFGHNRIEQIILLSAYCWVLIVELINSAIESLCDQVSTQYQTLIGRAKDIASAAVFLTILLGLLIWVMIIFT